MNLNKHCARCNTTKDVISFSKCKTNNDGLDYTCKSCCAEKRIINYNKKREDRLAYAKEYRLKNLDKYKENSKKKRQNPEFRKKVREWAQIWRDKNRDKVRLKHNQYCQKKKKEDPKFKLKTILRNRLLSVIRHNLKAGSAVKDLGCNIDELKIYLESKFKPGMTWKNHGLYGWHLDHIIPLSKFDLNNRDELLKACHYTNLQPLWAKENLIKNKY